MRFAESVKTGLSRYATFSGRAGRSEYWWFMLFVALGTVILSVLDSMVFGESPDATKVFAPLWQLALFIPLLAAGWRRLHDTERPSWWMLIPMLASLAFMLMLFAGIFAFGSAERASVDPEALRGSAALFGVTGMMIAFVVQLVLAVFMLWWLTRPGDLMDNAYGRPPDDNGEDIG